MGSLSGLFDLSRGALAANQAALDATANNVANQNTAGYTRQVASFSAGDVVTLSGIGGSAATQNSSGPTVATTSVRDRVLEARLQQTMQAQAGTNARSAAVSQIEGVFSISGSGATAGSTAIGTAMDSLFSSLTALAGDPSDGATRAGVLSAAQVVASTFHSAASQLQAVGASLSSDMADTVPQINGLTTTIAGLNKQISEASPQADAGALEDQRQLAIEKLSGLVSLDQITTEHNGITLTTQGGAALVQGGTATMLQAVVNSGQTAIENASGNDITAGVRGGSLGGQLAAQQVDLPQVSSALDALAYRVGTALNAQNEAGLTASGAVGGAIFTVPLSAAGAAAALAVIPTDAGAIAAAAAGEGSSGNSNAQLLADLATSTDASGSTMAGELGSLVAALGSQASALDEESTTQAATVTQLTTRRDSASGVSLDTEAANLSQFQKSYQAAAQLLTVLNELMATAINLGTQTTVT